MRIDLYTKTVLTIIALMLTAIVCKTFFNPETTASAQGPFAGVQYSRVGAIYSFFDTKTGDIWEYDRSEQQRRTWHAKVANLGEPFLETR
jgi:hypothetical protein